MVYLPWYYEVLVQTLAITTFVIVVSLRYHLWRRKDNHFLLYISQPEDGVESNYKGILWPVEWFLWPLWLEIIVHQSLSDMVSLCFDFESPNLQTDFFVYKKSENWQSGFLALDFLAGSYWSFENVLFQWIIQGCKPLLLQE